MSTHAVVIIGIIVFGAALELSGILNSFMRRKVFGIGAWQRMMIAVIGGGAILLAMELGWLPASAGN